MKKSLSLLLLLFCCLGCDDGNGVTPENPVPEPSDPVPPTTEDVPVILRSKSVDGDFGVGDCIGLYMVNYVDGQQVALKPENNYINNWKFRYDGAGNWSADQKLYYLNDTTSADFYAYYPYSEVEDATCYNVSVPSDQSAEKNYRKADFLWGNTLNCSPTTDPVDITLEHIMSKVVVILKPGTGFTEEELIASAPEVGFVNVKCNASFDLGTGELSVENSSESLVPYGFSSLEYRAMLLPQSVNDKDIVEIKIGKSVYKLRRTISFERGREYTFTVTIQRVEGGVNVGVGSWDVVDEDFGGVVS